jgi:hypothetical protein
MDFVLLSAPVRCDRIDAQAMRSAENAPELSGRTDPVFLDTLTTACAADRQWSRIVEADGRPGRRLDQNNRRSAPAA